MQCTARLFVYAIVSLFTSSSIADDSADVLNRNKDHQHQ